MKTSPNVEAVALKQCPCCRSERVGFTDPWRGGVAVKCWNCGVRTEMMAGKAAALSIWNTRRTTQPSGASWR